MRRMVREQLEALVAPRTSAVMEPEILLNEFENIQLSESAPSRGQGAMAEDYLISTTRQQILLSLRAFQPKGVWNLFCATAYMQGRGDPNALIILRMVTEVFIDNQDVRMVAYDTYGSIALTVATLVGRNVGPRWGFGRQLFVIDC